MRTYESNYGFLNWFKIFLFFLASILTLLIVFAEKFQAFVIRLTFVPEKIYVVLALVFGLSMVFITPPFQVPDEFNHFFRAFQVSEGTLVSTKKDNRLGGILPKSLPMTMSPYHAIPFHPENKQHTKNIINFLNLPLNTEDRVFVDFPNTALYSPIPYIPQSLGIIVGKSLQASPLILVYLGRLANLFLWIILISVAIKITPIYKWLFMILALTPMSLFQASSLSADCFTNAVAFLTISMFLYYAFDNAKIINNTDLYKLLMVTLLLALSKNVYILIIVLYLLIPKEKIGSTKKYYLLFILLILFNGLALAGWSMVIQHLYIPYDSYNTLTRDGQPLIQGVFPDKQFKFILSHFDWYFSVIGKSFWSQRDFIVDTFIGRLGWLDTPMPQMYLSLTKVLFLFFAFFEIDKTVAINLKNRLVLCLCFFGTIFIISTYVYMSWTPVGNGLISSIQGRYFIAVSPVFFSLFYNNKFHIHDNYFGITGSIFVFISLSLALFLLIQRFYL